jgi:WD40 repeat protein
MLRRKFLSLFSGAAIASPLAVHAQEVQPPLLLDEIQKLAQQLDKAHQENMQLRSMINQMRARGSHAVGSSEMSFPRGHEWYVGTHAIFNPQGVPIVTIISGRNVHIWDAATGRETARLLGHDDFVGSAVFSRNGSWILTRSKDKTARIWNAATAEEIAVLRRHEGCLTAAAFSPDEWSVVSASTDATARIWSFIGCEVAVLRGHKGSVTGASFDPDGSRIVTASEDRTVRIWDVQTGNEILVLRGHDNPVGCAVFSPDRSRVVSGESHDCTVRIWDATTGQAIATLRHDNSVGPVIAFSPDGSRIVTTDSIWTLGNAAHVWDAASGEEVAVLRHKNLVTSAEFSADSSRILTASWDRTARIWDVATAKAIATLWHRKPLSSAAWSSDEARIITTSSAWYSPSGSQIIRTGDVVACVWNISPATVSGEHFASTISAQELRRFTKLSGEDTQLSGYLDSVTEIDIASGIV